VAQEVLTNRVVICQVFQDGEYSFVFLPCIPVSV